MLGSEWGESRLVLSRPITYLAVGEACGVTECTRIAGFAVFTFSVRFASEGVKGFNPPLVEDDPHTGD